MRQSLLTLALLTMVASAPTLAETNDNKNITHPDNYMQIASESAETPATQCDGIAKSCVMAGFTHDGSAGKSIWIDCMKPLLMGKSVTGITISLDDLKVCRQQKIENMKLEIQELQQAMSVAPPATQ